jgi:CheY-like chemotaxis protein
MDNRTNPKPIITEQEAVVSYLQGSLQAAQSKWPDIRDNLKATFGDRFVVKDEIVAPYDLYLAIIAMDLQALPNLFPIEQAKRIEHFALKCLGRIEERGTYSVEEVQAYSSLFQDELRNIKRTGDPIAVIPARLLHRWLGEGIWKCESIRDGKGTGIIDPLLLGMTLNNLAIFCGFWKGAKDQFEIVEKPYQADAKPDSQRINPDHPVKVHKRVLVADHNEPVNHVIGAMLRSAGYEVRTTTRASEVVAITSEFKPSVVIIALVGPEIDGIKLSDQLNSHFPGIKILLLREVSVEILRYLLGKGIACEALQVPFEREQLLEIMKAWESDC